MGQRKRVAFIGAGRIAARLSEQMAQVEKMRQAADAQVEAAKALPAVLTNLPLAAFDNWDRANSARFDMIALAATSGEVFRRQYYTTNTLAGFPLIARMIVTQRNPTLARDDLASRLVVLRCLPLETKEPESLMQKEGGEAVHHRGEEKVQPADSIG